MVYKVSRGVSHAGLTSRLCVQYKKEDGQVSVHPGKIAVFMVATFQNEQSFLQDHLDRVVTPCHNTHIFTHRLTIACKQNRKSIVQEVPLSESSPGFTPNDFPHRKEAICIVLFRH